MVYEIGELNQTKTVLEQLAQGINPLTGKGLERESVLKQGELVNCLKTASAIVERFIRYGTGKQVEPRKFAITPNQKKAVQLTKGKIGVNEFSRCVNLCLENGAKKLTGVELNKRLKKLGILSEEKTADGKSRTTVNAKSADFGFASEQRTYKNESYEMILMNEVGKKYLLENLEVIMETEIE